MMPFLVLMTIWFLTQPLSAQSLSPGSIRDSIRRHVLLADVQGAMSALKSLKHLSLSQSSHGERRAAFIRYLKDWKAVEAAYVAGDINADLIDHPRRIDFFRHGHENIPKQLQTIINQKRPLEQALFKNSHHSMQGLEFILFHRDFIDNKPSKRQQQAVGRILNQQEMTLRDIESCYLENACHFTSKKPIKFFEALINRLVESSYKLKTWRLAEPFGFGSRIAAKKDLTKLEFSMAKASAQAMQAIVSLHTKLWAPKKYRNLHDLQLNKRFEQYKPIIVTRLQITQDLLNTLKKPLVLGTSETVAQKIYQSVSKLHRLYYQMLAESVNLTAKILDADGD